MNPQNRNLFTAVALSLLILLGFHHFYEVPRLEQQRQMALEEQAQSGGGQIAGATGDSPSARLSALPEATMVVDRGDALAGGPRIKINNAQLYGSVSKTGIRFDDLTFANYYTALDHKAHVDLLSPKGSESPYYASFGWIPAKADMQVPDDATKWKITSDGDLAVDHPLTMEWDNGKGLIFHRTIAIDANYMFTITQTVDNKSGEAVTLYPYASVTRQGEPILDTKKNQDSSAPHHAIFDTTGADGEIGVLNNRLVEFSYLKMKDHKYDSSQLAQTSKGGWVGSSDKYWLVAIIPDQNEDINAEFRHQLSDDKVDLYQSDYKAGAKVIQPGASVTETSHMFAGAKKVDLLTHYREDLGVPNFDLAVNWGFFWFLTKPFFYGIDFLAKLLGNFGLGILAFTVVIRALILPLAWKTFREMNRMSDLSPQLSEIKAKHGPNNKPAMQAEILELYQREKVNPVSGCLPMVLQIPIFLSLFKVLSTTIEMRQQPFFWYVKDLSAEDPTNLFNLFGLVPDWHFVFMGMHLPPHLGFLPLILGCTLMLLQLNGPKVADPLHQKMMLINPVIFTFFMAHLPVGLVIYYIWSNSISIGQQRFIRWFYRKRFKKEPARPTLDLPGQKS